MLEAEHSAEEAGDPTTNYQITHDEQARQFNNPQSEGGCEVMPNATVVLVIAGLACQANEAW
jgi:hypothetical protein